MLKLMETGAVPPRIAIEQMAFEGRDAILQAMEGADVDAGGGYPIG